jgi:hypothetical protein
MPSASSVSRTDRPAHLGLIGLLCRWFRLLLRRSGFRLGLWIKRRGAIPLGRRGFRVVAPKSARIPLASESTWGASGSAVSDA